MNFLDVIAHALGNLRRQKLRTLLTTIGVAIGVLTTAIMMAFPAGVMNILALKLDRTELLTSMTVFGTRIPRSFTSFDDFRRFQQQQVHAPRMPEGPARARAANGVTQVKSIRTRLSGGGPPCATTAPSKPSPASTADSASSSTAVP